MVCPRSSSTIPSNFLFTCVLVSACSSILVTSGILESCKSSFFYLFSILSLSNFQFSFISLLFPSRSCCKSSRCSCRLILLSGTILLGALLPAHYCPLPITFPAVFFCFTNHQYLSCPFCQFIILFYLLVD